MFGTPNIPDAASGIGLAMDEGRGIANIMFLVSGCCRACVKTGYGASEVLGGPNKPPGATSFVFGGPNKLLGAASVLAGPKPASDSFGIDVVLGMKV